MELCSSESPFTSESGRELKGSGWSSLCYHILRLGGGLTAGIGFKYWYLALYFCVPFCEQLLEYYTGNRSVADAEENLMTCLADLFSQISSQKKKTGVIAPKRFVQRLKKHSYLSLTNEKRCRRCETVTARDDSFLDLSLDIEQNITKLLTIFNDILANL